MKKKVYPVTHTNVSGNVHSYALPDVRYRVYFLGIGGIAMANLACLLKKRGYLVSGSDLDTFGPSALLLKKYGITYFKNHSENNIKKFKPDVAVIGNAIKRGNPSLEHVLNHQIPYRSMPEVIKEKLIKTRKSIVITGTSGKTTTTALVAWILQKAGLKPTALIGGIAKNLDSGFLNGTGKYVVIEGDEYNSSFWDASPKFMHYQPHIGIINNIQADHLDIYENMENIADAFKKFVKIIPSKGLLILNRQDKYTPLLAKDTGSRIKTFGRNGDVWTTNKIAPTPDGLSFVVYSGSKRLGRIETSLLGKHNVENILAAITVALELKIPFKKITEAVAEFKGVKRRLEIIYQKGNIIIIDDFAHNPDKVLASLSAIRSHFPKHQLIAIFEPRTGSSRRKFFQNAYISSFKPADLVYIAEPYKKEVLNKKEVFSSKKLVSDLTKKGTEAHAMADADSIIAHLKKNKPKLFQKSTIIAVMTSGEFDGIHQKLIDLVA
ncbi:MAG: Mur ligase family protein [Candidatus Taylorbacteria bacterium]|nr:Mur ligase family protein [Candidatus Taylorbacteria bacterium]